MSFIRDILPFFLTETLIMNYLFNVLSTYLFWYISSLKIGYITYDKKYISDIELTKGTTDEREAQILEK